MDFFEKRLEVASTVESFLSVLWTKATGRRAGPVQDEVTLAFLRKKLLTPIIISGGQQSD